MTKSMPDKREMKPNGAGAGLYTTKSLRRILSILLNKDVINKYEEAKYLELINQLEAFEEIMGIASATISFRGKDGRFIKLNDYEPY